MDKVLIKAKIQAQINIFKEISMEYLRISKFEAFRTYSDMNIGLQRALDILNELPTKPIIGHELLEKFKERKEA